MPTSLPVECTVSEFLDLVTLTFQSRSFVVVGEISEVKQSGRAVYFKLTDTADGSVLSCLMWTSKLSSLGFDLEVGIEVKVIGTVNIYKPRGTFSLLVNAVVPVGEGALQAAFEALKKKLEEQGYFAPERKRTLPQYPTSIALVTANRSDAQKDILTHLAGLGLKIYFVDARVEGIRSISSIVDAIATVNAIPAAIDLLILTRGGGSLESLQSFNSFEVANAIYTSRIPVISAVGHENDVTIADLVADLRASTPTHAGRMIREPFVQATQTVTTISQALQSSFAYLLLRNRQQIDTYSDMLVRMFATFLSDTNQSIARFHSTFPLLSSRLRQERTLLDRHKHALHAAFHELIRRVKLQVHTQETLLRVSDPQQKLAQGYSIVRDSFGKIVKDPRTLTPGVILTLQMKKAEIHTAVQEVLPYE